MLRQPIIRGVLRKGLTRSTRLEQSYVGQLTRLTIFLGLPPSLSRRKFSVRAALRAEATTRSTPPAGPIPAPSLSAPPRKRARRSLRGPIYAALFLLLGVAAGSVVRAIILPPPLPVPDTPEDEDLTTVIRRDVSELALVRELRKHRDEWQEFDAYMNLPGDEAAESFSAGALRGSRGIAVHRVFWNKKEKRSIAIVFFGGALTGWPGVVHGGAIATILQENLERIATGPVFGTSNQVGLRLGDVMFRYRKPTQANSLYVVRAEVEEAEDAGILGDATPTRIHVRATLESASDGKICVEASGFCSSSLSAPIIPSYNDPDVPSSWSGVRSKIGHLAG